MSWKKSKNCKPKLPRGWRSYVSKSHPDRVYYHNHRTGSSSWRTPIPIFNRRNSDPDIMENAESDLEDYDSAVEFTHFEPPATKKYKNNVVPQKHSVQDRLQRIKSEIVPETKRRTNNSNPNPYSEHFNYNAKQSSVMKRLCGNVHPSNQARQTDLTYFDSSSSEDQTSRIGPQTEIPETFSHSDRFIVPEVNLKRKLGLQNRVGKKISVQDRLVRVPKHTDKSSGSNKHFFEPTPFSSTLPKFSDRLKRVPQDTESYIISNRHLEIDEVHVSVPASSSSNKFSVQNRLEKPKAQVAETKSLEGSRKRKLINHSATTSKQEPFLVHSTTEKAQKSKSRKRKSMNIETESMNTKIQKTATKSKIKKRKSSDKNILNSSTSQPTSIKEDNEMEWDVIPEEKIFDEITNIRKNELKSANSSPKTLLFQKSDDQLMADFYLVLDTNVFIHSFPDIKVWRDSHFEGLGRPVLYIPWRVLNELDHLKNSDKIGKPARIAIKYVNDSIATNHAYIRAQNVDEFNKTEKSDNPDDDILYACIQLKTKAPNSTVILVTNDINLSNKAIINNFKVLTSKEAQTHLKNKTNPLQQLNNNETAILNDEILCRVKIILQETLSQIIRTELMFIYKRNWINKVLFKPPWTVEQLIDCFIKHWRDGLNLQFPRETIDEMRNLKTFFKKDVSGFTFSHASTLEILNLIRKCFQLFEEPNDPRAYQEIIYQYIPEIDKLMDDLKKINSPLPPVNSQVSLSSTISNNSLSTSKVPLLSNNTETDLDYSGVSDESMDEDIFLPEPTQCDTQTIINHFRNRFHTSVCMLHELMGKPVEPYERPLVMPSLSQLTEQFPIISNDMSAFFNLLKKVLSVQPDRLNTNDKIVQNFAEFIVNKHREYDFPLQLNDQNQVTESVVAYLSNDENRRYMQQCCEDLEQYLLKILFSQ